MSPEKVKIYERFGNLDDAVAMATEAHTGQKRRSGEDAITHPLAVVNILREEMGIENPEILIAGVLHDCVEDADVTLSDIKEKFGGKVEEIVDGVTKIKGRTDHSTTKRVVKLTPEVAIVKLADRLHNMRTLNFMPRNKQIEKAQETLRVYSVLAESLGMWKVKTELEDLCFFYLDQDDYLRIVKQIENDPRRSEEFVEAATDEITQILVESGIESTVETRKCGVWEAGRKQRKLTQEGIGSMEDMRAVKDVTRLQVIVDRPEMERVAGLLADKTESSVEPNIIRLIGKNKTDTGYQAIHIIVNYKEGPVEIAILTKEMQESNDWGKVALLRRGETDLGEVPVVRVFVKNKKLRLFRAGATVWDVAAVISDTVLEKAKYASINGARVKNLSQLLKDGDYVVIHTNGEEADLTDITCLPSTRQRVKVLEGRRERLKLISRGKDLMRGILEPRGLIDISDLGILDNLLTHFGCNSYEEMYVQLGNESLDIDDVSARLSYIGITEIKPIFSTLELNGLDRMGILREVVGTIYELGRDILNSVSVTTEEGAFYIRILVAGRLSCEEKKKFMKIGNCIIV